MQFHRKLRQPPKPCRPNQTWALDWTYITIGGENHTLLGVIDHGSRKPLALQFADKSVKTVLAVLTGLIKTSGKLISSRTDALYFAPAMRRLRIRHRRTAPHSPWMNGRIERFFGTFKQAIRQIETHNIAGMQQAIDEFRC